MGGLFPGAPTMGVGFTEEHGWGATVNKPDLVDIYVLEMNPDNPNQYRLDDEWRDLEVGEVKLKLKLWGFIPWSSNGKSSDQCMALPCGPSTVCMPFVTLASMR